MYHTGVSYLRFIWRNVLLTLLISLPSHSFSQETKVIDGVTYDVVTITVDAPSYDENKKPEFAKVKYNKLCPLVITSDDMGAGELIRNWAFFNGYPVYANNGYGHVSMGDGFLETPYNQAESGLQVQALKRDTHQPLTYSDGTGGVRRFTATSAIWPHQVNNTNYTLIKGSDAKTMIRMGWSFAQHDVDYSENDIKAGVYTAAQVEARFGPLSQSWAENATGIGLKVMVEPTGAHTYVDAGKLSNEICWNIFQNGVSDTYPEMTHTLISDWTSGTDWTTFGTNKPDKTTRRIFFQGNEEEFTNAINNADGTKFIIGGTHGIGDDILTFLKDLDKTTGTSAKKDQFWVTGADEVWEYYHLYNNAKIENINYANGTLTFQVKVPQYKKNQFRELTINIPGVTGGTTCTFSDNVITGSYQQNPGQYTINFGLEDKIYTYIKELTDYYRSHFHNTYVKDDAQYLINLLKPGTKKNEYQTNLDKEPNYSYTVKNSFGTVLTSGASDVASEVNYKYPRYILSEGTLYESAKNTNKIQGTNHIANYVGAFTPSGKDQEVTVNYTATTIDNVTFYSEGEDLKGVTIATEDFSKIGNNSGIAYALRYASNGGAGEILSPVTATTLTPGKYTLVAAIGDTHTSATAQFAFKVGDKTVLSLTTEDVSGYIKEYTKEGITVKTDQSLTIEAVNSGGSFWVDFLYLIKTGEYDSSAPDVELTTATATVDMTDDSNKTVTITATATAKGTASIARTVIKDSNDQIVAQSTEESPNTCSYTFTPSQVGDVVFTAEATDNTENGGKTGLSDDLTITVKSDFTLRATSNLGDELANTTFSGQVADINHRFMYPRYILKGKNLYETAPNSTDIKELHYGKQLTFTLANKNIDETIEYSPLATNVVFYQEGEDIEGTRSWTFEPASPDYGKGEYYALSLGSMGKCGAVGTGVSVTTLPAGEYKIFAGLGTTNSATYTFKLNDETLHTHYNSVAGGNYAINQYESPIFTLNEEKTLSVSCDKLNSNSQNWIDYIYIQEIPAPLSIDMRAGQQWASWYGDYDYAKPTGTEAYIATDVDNGNVTVSEIGAIPAHTGVLLKRTNANEAAILTSESGLIEDVNTEGNLLRAGTPTSYTDYVLQNNAFVLWGGGSLAPHRCYLPGGSISGSRVLTIGDNVTTVPHIKTEGLTTTKWYNLQGIPANKKPKKSGLYIFNRKKIIIK